MHGEPLTTNVAIFWLAGTKPIINNVDASPLGTDTAVMARAATGDNATESTAEERKAHWEHVYRSKAPAEVSWFQEHPEKSLQLITA